MGIFSDNSISAQSGFLTTLAARLGITNVGQPSLIFVGGYAGSGKTHIADALSESLISKGVPTVILDKDTVCRPLLEAGLKLLSNNPDDRESDLYLNHLRPLEYECLMNSAFNNAAMGVNAVLSAPFIQEFRDKDWLETLQEQASILEISTAFLWINCEKDVAKARIIKRGAKRDVWKLENWDTYQKNLPWGYTDMPNVVLPNLLVYDNSSDLSIFGFDSSGPDV